MFTAVLAGMNFVPSKTIPGAYGWPLRLYQSTTSEEYIGCMYHFINRAKISDLTLAVFVGVDVAISVSVAFSAYMIVSRLRPFRLATLLVLVVVAGIFLGLNFRENRFSDANSEPMFKTYGWPAPITLLWVNSIKDDEKWIASLPDEEYQFFKSHSIPLYDGQWVVVESEKAVVFNIVTTFYMLLIASLLMERVVFGNRKAVPAC